MPALPPDRLNDLREIAKALRTDRAPNATTDRSRHGRQTGLTLIAVAMTAALVTLAARRAWNPCAFGACGPTTAATIPLRDTVAVALAPADPSPVPTENSAGTDEDIDGNEIGALLAAEREARGMRVPEPEIRVVRTPGRTAKARSAPPRPARTVTLRTPPSPAAVTAAARAQMPPAAVAPPEPAVAVEGRVMRHPPDRHANDRERDRRGPRELGEVAPAEAAPDLSGRWLLTNAIATTNVPAFAGLRIRFRVQLEQHGNRITGHGEKFTIDDRPVPPSQRTPIELEGTVRGRDVFVRFVERGSRRVSNGGFRWRISPEGNRLDGTFGSTAASSRGRSYASRD